MKAVVVEQYESADNAQLKEVERPKVSAGQVRVRIQAASVGFVDGLKVQGLYQTKDPLPFTPGSEFAGVVDEAGPMFGDLRVACRAWRGRAGWQNILPCPPKRSSSCPTAS